MNDIADRGYSRPEVLVSTDWLKKQLNNPNVRIVESNEDPLLYRSGHITGAVEIDWTEDLNDPIRRDYLDQKRFQSLMSRKGISNDMTVVFYGDKNNWWACYAFWVFQLFGHKNAKILDGGRIKWEKEGGPLVRDTVAYQATNYTARPRNDSAIRAFRDQVRKHSEDGGGLVDVRSPQEFSGERLHMPDYPNEGALRGGHIPGAKNVPWAMAANEDGTFKDFTSLRRIYEEEAGLKRDEQTIAYCRIGERSSHTWFVLSYLLGFDDVLNYDGSWTEWGNAVGMPIER